MLSTNGPAIWGGCVTRPVLTEASGRKHRAESWYFSHEALTVQAPEEGMAHFLPSGYKFY